MFLLGLLLLLLPVAGWQAAVQVEEYLREARQDALIASAELLARNFEAESGLLTGNTGLYVNQIDFPLEADGYDDDWRAWLPWAQTFASNDDRVRAELLLARNQRWLYGLFRVWDSKGPRASHSPAGFVPGDAVILALEDRRGRRQVRIFPSVPGAFDMLPMGQGSEATSLSLTGAWRERTDGQGYLLEFRIPAALAESRLGIAAVDASQPYFGAEPVLAGTVGADGAVELTPLALRDASWQQRLEDLRPQAARIWLLNAEGWVMAVAGDTDQTDPGAARSWWQSLIYRLLANRALSVAEERDPSIDLRLAGTEIGQALNGRAAVRWEPARGQFTVNASAAAPIWSDSEVVAAVVIEQAMDSLLLAANRTVARIVILTLAVVVLMCLLLFAFASLHSLRIRRLRNAVEGSLSDEGQLSSNLPFSTSGDEIGDLSRSFGALLGELSEYNEYLRSLAGKLSHELNTPLAVVRSSLENLTLETLSSEARVYVERATSGADRLQSILRAMSEVKRLEQALERPEPEEFDLCEVVNGCLESYRALAPQFRWSAHCPAAAIKMRGAPELVAQMLDKLTDNARSFTPDDGHIKISATLDRRGATVTVSNDGPLLPEKLKNRLFHSLVSVRKHQAESSHLGLGLHIVRLVAKAHRGAVGARNRSDGSGVEFWVRLRSMR